MLAILYLLIALFFGDRLRRTLLPPTRSLYASIATHEATDAPDWLFDIPAAMVLGLLPMMWMTYALAVLTAYIPSLTRLVNPLLPANLVVMPLVFILSLVLTGRLRERAHLKRLADHEDPAASAVRRKRVFGFMTGSSGAYLLAMLAFTLFGLWLMRTGLRIENGQLRAGYSVFSDFAPHTALVSSFARGANYPAQYPHFPMDGIRYHFIFYFLCGNLDFLGLPIDWAINLPSVMGLAAFCSLLGLLGALITGRRIVFLFAPAMMFFRSSFAFVTFLRDRIRLGDTLGEAVRAMGKTTVFIGNTLHEDWGLFAINVYANQRHFLFGLSAMLFLLFLFLPLLHTGLRPGKPGFGAFVRRLFSRESWAIPSMRVLAAALLTVICLPYLHGSVLIASLLVLAVMFLFSAGRLQYLLVAMAAIGATLLQADLFSGGAQNVADFRIQFGFLADSRTLLGMIFYAAEVFGVAFFLMWALPWVQPSRYRAVLAGSFLLPFLFAFTVSLTPDVTVNHKYLLIAVALSNLFIADLVCRLWRRPKYLPQARRVDLEDPRAAGQADTGHRLQIFRAQIERLATGPFALRYKTQLRTAHVVSRRLLAVFLAVLLTATGVADVVTYANSNRLAVAMDLDSPVTEWIMANTAPNAVFLTDTYAFDEFFYSGRMAYYGHPYYAWSAGHDTAAREVVYRRLLTGCGGDYNAFRVLCRSEGISYLLATDTLRKKPEANFNNAFFQDNFVALASFPKKDNATIYDLR